VEVNLRPRVKVPCIDTEAWSDTNCALAYQTLAATPSLVTDPAIGPALRGINLSREAFTQWLARRGYPLPTFWATIEMNNDTPGSVQKLTLPATQIPPFPEPADVSAETPAPAKRRAGRKAKFDWAKIEQFVSEQLTKNGHWDDEPEDGWRSQNDLVVAVQKRFEPYYGEGKPDESTIKGRLPAMIARWRRRAAGN
jgi:hypothetical protein